MVKKFKKEVLESKSVKELRNMCKTFGIKVYTHKKSFTKSELIEKLLQVRIPVDVEKVKGSNKTVNKRNMEDKENMNVVTSKGDNGINNVKEGRVEIINVKTRNFNYDKMVVGCFVAFRYRGKADTAKIYAINRKQRLIKVETKLGTRYMVPFERILWVKCSKDEFWPKSVLMELKGHDKCKWEGVDFDEPYAENKRECKKII